MIPEWRQHITHWSDTERLFWGFGLVTLICILAAVVSNTYLLAGVPAFFLILYLSVVDFRQVFWLLIACLPLSTEFYLPNGFGTDLPTEPLMVGLTGIGLLYLLRHGQQFRSHFLQHPITLILLAHYAWILVTTLTSDLQFVSLKFALAKTWYIVPFYFLAGYLLRDTKQWRTLFWVFFLPLLFTVIVILIRHGGYGFGFEEIKYVLHPFQRNHVNYAAMLAYFSPVLFFARHAYARGTRLRYFLDAATVLILIAIYLSYTRAAYVALIGAIIMYFVFRWRLIRWVLAGALLTALLGVGYLVQQDRYLAYAPNYDRTISHQSFDNLLEATYKFEDISTMERLYRWVAGFHMTPAHPFFGFGPGNFVNFYESYTVKSFRTYVSDNPERSGIHSYYLMTLVEQGVVGLLLLLTFVAFTLIQGERIYHQTKEPEARRLIMGFLLSIVIIDAFQIINDLLETDKVGPFFFLSVAILVRQDLRNHKLGLRPQDARSSSDQSSG